VFTENMKVTYENDTPWGQVEITQNLDSHTIKLHWASIFVPRT
jgi:hypothetical protein